MVAKVTPTGRATAGALVTYLGPRLATDAKMPDIGPIVEGLKAKTYTDQIPVIVARVRRAMKGRLAQDANIDDVVDLLDALGDSGILAMDAESEEDGSHPGGGTARASQENALDKKAADEEDMDADMASDAACEEMGRDETPEEREEREMKASDKKARDKLGRDETMEEKEEREAKDKKARDRRMSRDAKRAKDAKDKLGRDETPEEAMERKKAERAEDRKRMGKDEPPPFKGRPETGGGMTKDMVTKDEARKMATQAADAAIVSERTRQQGIYDARSFVRPWVGEVSMSFDSAEGVYKHALGALGVKTDGVHESAFKTILGVTPKPSARDTGHSRLATDAKPAGDFNSRFKDAGRIGHM